MPRLRKARLPGSCNLPEQLAMSPSRLTGGWLNGTPVWFGDSQSLTGRCRKAKKQEMRPWSSSPWREGGTAYGKKGSLSTGAIPKRGDFDSTIRSLPATTCDKMVEDPRSAFNFAGKIHLPTTVSGESSVSENLAPDALEN
jgi:hypothetical protein